MAELAKSSTNWKAIRAHVARHPLISFIFLAYALSFSWLLSFQIDLGWVI